MEVAGDDRVLALEVFCSNLVQTSLLPYPSVQMMSSDCAGSPHVTCRTNSVRAGCCWAMEQSFS